MYMTDTLPQVYHQSQVRPVRSVSFPVLPLSWWNIWLLLAKTITGHILKISYMTDRNLITRLLQATATYLLTGSH